MGKRTTWGILLISAASLAYEIALTRLFAVQQFYHFAFVVISIATMGFAASGLFLSIGKLKPPPYLLALLFSIAVFTAYTTINSLPFDSYSIAWDPRQWWILLIYFALSGAPFLASGWTIGSALNIAGTEAYRPYAATMLGAAIGCPLALVGMDLLGGEGAIGLVIIIGLLASILLGRSSRYALVLIPIALMSSAVFIIPIEPLALKFSPYKPLRTALLATDARLTVTDWGAAVRLDVVERPGLRSFPGLSLNNATVLPEQAGVYLDGEGPLPITRINPEDPDVFQIGNRFPSSLAYTLRSPQEVLILDWGAGTPAIFAASLSSADIWLPNDQPSLTDLLRTSYADFSYDLLTHPNVHVLDRTARGVLADKSRNYDLIEFALSDVYRPVTSGAFSLGEDYLLTVDAISDAWRRLDSDGIMVITRWIGTPPSYSARAWNTVLAALRHSGTDDLSEHVLAFRSMRTLTILVSPQPFNRTELSAIRNFLDHNAFDAVVLADLQPADVNRFNRLPEPVYHKLFTTMLNDPASAENYSLRLDPPVDNKPFFNHFFRWAQTPEIIATLGLFWQPFGGSGYFVLLVLMAMMILLASLLIFSSLVLSTRQSGATRPTQKAMLFFAGLGAGYLLVEIPLIQQFTLLLDHPANSLAGVLFILLFSSGLGSWLSPRIELRTALALLLSYLALIALFVPDLIHWLLPATELVRWLVMFVVLTPLGILMGVPFASGLRRLEMRQSGWIPWAWAVNGAFSGISGVGAAMISLDAGFQSTLFVGFCAYLLSLLTARFQSSITKISDNQDEQKNRLTPVRG